MSMNKERSPVSTTEALYGFPHLLMIAASAGSGKTHQLARRYVEFTLASSEVPHSDLSEILAITFTKKAAREMKDRVLEHLKKLALKEDDALLRDTLKRLNINAVELPSFAEDRIDEVIERYSDFQIQTIDSFLYRVITSAALDLDLRPEPEISLSYSTVLDYSISLMLRRVGPGLDENTTKIIDDFLRLFNQLEERFIWNPLAKLQSTFMEFLEVEAKETGSLVFEDHSDEIRECRETISRTYQKVTAPPLTKKRVKDFETALEHGEILTVLTKYKPGSVPVYKTKVPKDKTELFERAQKEWSDLSGTVGRLALSFSSSRFNPYGEVYRRFRSYLDETRRRTGITVIGDVAKRLNQYLEQDMIPDVYVRLGNRLYHFLVDEFQDTNPVQWKSLLPLITESLAKNGSLFLVGDLKQAIYMFRNADYRIMRGMFQEIRKETSPCVWLPPSVIHSSHLETLGKNRRSGETILQYVEEVFKKRLKSLLGTEDFQVDLTGLTDFAQEPIQVNKGRGYVRVMSFPKEKKGDGDDPPEREALLGILSDLRDRGYGYRDIAILSDRNSRLVTMVDWLTRAGVPVSASSSLDIRNRKVVNEIVELLRFLDSPVDDLALANFLAGETMAKAAVDCGLEFDLEELCGPDPQMRARDPKYLYQRLREHEKYGVLWEELFETLYQRTGYSPLYDIVSLALKKFRVFENFPEECGSLVKLLEAINELESKGLNSSKDFLEQTADIETDLFNLELPEYADAVRLMTFHKSKGLGFPVVINMLYESGHRRDQMHYDKRGEGIRVFYINKNMCGKSADLDRIYNRRRTDEQIQWFNALYVACTRARSELYNIVMPGKNSIFYTHLFGECELGSKTRGEAETPGRRLVPTPVKLKLRKDEGVDWLSDESWSQERWLDAKRGEIYHRVLEEIEFLSDGVEETVARVVENCEGMIDRPLEPEEIRRCLALFLSHADVKRWFVSAPGRAVFREKEFADRSGRLLRMDRVIVEKNTVTVIDYKTGEPKDYSNQVQEYMSLLADIYPEKNVVGYVAYVDSRIVEEIG